MHSSHTVWLSLFFPQVPWCYLFLFLISYVLRHILPFCLLFLKPQLHFTFEIKRFIYINLKKYLEKHIKAKKQTWKLNEMCCWDGKGPSEQSAPMKSIKRGLLLISKWYLIHSSGFSALVFFFPQYFLLFPCYSIPYAKIFRSPFLIAFLYLLHTNLAVQSLSPHVRPPLPSLISHFDTDNCPQSTGDQ